MIKAYAASTAGSPLEKFEYQPSPLSPNEVEINVKYCGICHSDISMIDNAWGMSQYPIVAGHEVAGTIAQIGSAVTTLKVGQRVGLGWHCGYCNNCAQCKVHDHNLCSHAHATIVGHHGGFADKVRAQAESVVVIPDAIALEQAGPLFCGGITVYNPLIQYNISSKHHVAVVGIGGLGHAAITFLKALGCEITAFSSNNKKKDEIIAMGADHYHNSTDKEAIDACNSRFDFILTTANKKLDWNLYVAALKPKGRLHFVGATLDPLDLSVFGLIMQQRQVSGSPVGSPQTIANMLDFVAKHHIKLQIEKFKLSEINTAISKIKAGEIRYRAILEIEASSAANQKDG